MRELKTRSYKLNKSGTNETTQSEFRNREYRFRHT